MTSLVGKVYYFSLSVFQKDAKNVEECRLEVRTAHSTKNLVQSTVLWYQPKLSFMVWTSQISIAVLFYKIEVSLAVLPCGTNLQYCFKCGLLLGRTKISLAIAVGITVLHTAVTAPIMASAQLWCRLCVQSTINCGSRAARQLRQFLYNIYQRLSSITGLGEAHSSQTNSLFRSDYLSFGLFIYNREMILERSIDSYTWIVLSCLSSLPSWLL